MCPFAKPLVSRLTPGDGYLEALLEPNVETTFSPVSSVSSTSLITSDGAHHEVDAIICATGYDTAWTPHFTLVGRRGRTIEDAWSPTPRCYLGMAAPGFPNYFVMNGPRGNLANGTVLPCFETELEYVIQAARKMQADRIKILDVRGGVVNSLDEYIDAWQETSVFSGGCRSWYKDNTVDGKVLVWGGSVRNAFLFILCRLDALTALVDIWAEHSFSQDHQDPEVGALRHCVLGC